MELGETISDLIASTKQPGAIPSGMTQETYIEYKLQSSLVETNNVDMLVMGGAGWTGMLLLPEQHSAGLLGQTGKKL